MYCTGIICEYNPFHKGHQYHIQNAVHLSHQQPIIAVMSGNYVQRAEPAIANKWLRAEMALREGAALVIEIPTVHSISSSEFYAGAGIRLMQLTGITDSISYGVESCDRSLLETVSNIVFREPPEYTQLLKKHIASGLGYAAARAQALTDLIQCDPAILKSPNFILAVEYQKAILRYQAPIRSLPVLRQGHYHDDSMETLLPSASAIRQAIRSGRPYASALPDSCAALLSSDSIAEPLDAWSQELYYRLCFHTPETLRRIPDVAEGLENRILSYANRPRLISELVSDLSNKRYPQSRIRRILLRILLDISAIPDIQYIRVLGFRKDQQEVLSALTRHAQVPVITNLARQLPTLPKNVQQLLYDEIRYTDLYTAHAPGSQLTKGAELTQPIIRI